MDILPYVHPYLYQINIKNTLTRCYEWLWTVAAVSCIHLHPQSTRLLLRSLFSWSICEGTSYDGLRSVDVSRVSLSKKTRLFAQFLACSWYQISPYSFHRVWSIAIESESHTPKCGCQNDAAFYVNKVYFWSFDDWKNYWRQQVYRN